MTKITIILEDVGDIVNMTTHTDRPIVEGEPLTQAMLAALAAVQAIHDELDHVLDKKPKPVDNPRLTKYQQEHLAKFSAKDKAQMENYFLEAANVVIYKQNECGGDTPPYAIGIAGCESFWVDCCRTVDLAKSKAEQLGLCVIDILDENHGFK